MSRKTSKSTGYPTEIIDLTDSFTLVNHAALANSVIDLDDSLIETRVRPHTSSEHAFGEQIAISDSSIVEVTSPLHPSQAQVHNGTQKSRKITSLHQANKDKPNSTPIRDSSNKSGSGISCPICFEMLGVHPMVSTKCGHVYCQPCLEKALQNVKKCPTCRRPLHGKAAFHPLFLK